MKKLIEIFKNKAETSFSFGSGTILELNSQSNINYPLIWMLFPVIIKNNTTNGNIVSQSYSFALQFITSGKTTETQEQINNHFDLLNNIMVGFIQSIQVDNEELERDQMIFGNATMINKKLDNVHYGWQVAVDVTLPIDLNLCCNMFE